MASAITGINRSVTGILESAGPKTFFVYRYFSGGLDVSDGSDELSPWRRMPWITVDEAEVIRKLPAVRDVNIGEYTNGPVSFESAELKSVAMAGMSPSWNLVNGGNILAGRNFTPMEYAAGARVETTIVHGGCSSQLRCRGWDGLVSSGTGILLLHRSICLSWATGLAPRRPGCLEGRSRWAPG